MKRIFLAAILLASSGMALAADVGVSISIGQPGFYGRIDIGDYPRPQLLYAEPVLIEHAPIAVVRQPIYLHVPPGHAKNWRRYCGRYSACGQPVYFVQDSWYNEVYVPRYRERDGWRDDRRYDRRDDRYDGRRDYRDDHRGKGKHGNGHGKGKGRD